MPLIDDNDINKFLPADKLSAETADLLEEIKEDIERVIRGNLAGQVDAAEMALWLTPATTPEIIRAIGGRLGAAFIYRRAYSEDSLEDPQYAQYLYNEAMAMMLGVINGTIVVPGVTVTGGNLTADMFYPNDPNTAAPKFTMDQVF